jgi:hydrogenase nickel incorporation protein HypB
VTEGEDKPLKYPTIFNTADLAVITKTDLADVTEFDWAAARQNIETVRPGMPILGVAAKSGQGMNDWLDLIGLRLTQSRERGQQRQAATGENGETASPKLSSQPS